MHRLPAKIREFWKAQGYELQYVAGFPWRKNMYWYASKLHSSDRFDIRIAVTFANKHSIYYWNGKEYSKSQILKIYKLKAFS